MTDFISSAHTANPSIAFQPANFIDLDGFKEVNDQHGHAVGDKLLSVLSRRMTQVLREDDTLARLGGDEFVAVLLDLPENSFSLPILDRLIEVAAQPVPIGDALCEVSASINVSYYPQGEDIDADQLLRQADQAMYFAKQAGKNRYHVFDTDKDHQLRNRYEGLDSIANTLSEMKNAGRVEALRAGIDKLQRLQADLLGLQPPDQKPD